MRYYTPRLRLVWTSLAVKGDEVQGQVTVTQTHEHSENIPKWDQARLDQAIFGYLHTVLKFDNLVWLPRASRLHPAPRCTLAIVACPLLCRGVCVWVCYCSTY